MHVVVLVRVVLCHMISSLSAAYENHEHSLPALKRSRIMIDEDQQTAAAARTPFAPLVCWLAGSHHPNWVTCDAYHSLGKYAIFAHEKPACCHTNALPRRCGIAFMMVLYYQNNVRCGRCTQ